MQTKYNIRDTVWNYTFYEGINLKFRKCTVIGIRVKRSGVLEYEVESADFYGTAHFFEYEIRSDKRQVLQDGKESCNKRIAQLNAYVEDIDKELENVEH